MNILQTYDQSEKKLDNKISPKANQEINGILIVSVYLSSRHSNTDTRQSAPILTCAASCTVKNYRRVKCSEKKKRHHLKSKSNTFHTDEASLTYGIRSVLRCNENVPREV